MKNTGDSTTTLETKKNGTVTETVKTATGTVAVIVNADGTEKIVSTSVTTENGVVLPLDGGATVKVIDNAKRSTDVPATNVFYNEICALSAREIMIDTSSEKFDLNSSMTPDQIANVAGRIIGAVDASSFIGSVAWGAENGLKTFAITTRSAAAQFVNGK